jgi:hypothetical protein
MTTAGDNSTGGAAAASSADVDRREGDPYARSSAATCPPLVRLQCYGMCCPFLETEEERDARAGYSELQDRPIAWYRKKRAGPPAAALDGIGGGDVRRVASSGRDLLAELGLMFGVGGGGGGGGRTDTTATPSPEPSMTYVGVLATMSVVDTDAHGPVIQIRALDDGSSSSSASEASVREYVATGRPWWEDLRDRPPSAVVPLYLVDSVTSGWNLTGGGGWNTGGVVRLYASPSPLPPSSGSGFLGDMMTAMTGGIAGTGRELLRFDPRGDFESNEDVDDVIVQLRSLVDWNRRRMARDIEEGRAIAVPKSPASPGYVAMS